MLVGHQLSLFRHGLQGSLFQDGAVPLDVVDELWLADHEADVDEVAVPLGLLPKFPDAAVLGDVQDAEPLSGIIGGHSDHLAVGAVEGQQLGDVQVGDTVAVGEHKGLIADVVLHPPDPSAGHGTQAGIYHRHLPWLRGVVVDGHFVFAAGEVVCNVRGVEEVVGEVFLNDVLLVTGTYDELVEAVVAVELHDVPKDGFAAQIYHRLGFELAFFTDAGAVAAGED